MSTKHLEEAKALMSDEKKRFIQIDNHGTEAAPTLLFAMQCDTVEQVGEQGLHPQDLIEYALGCIYSLNKEFPCRENSITITKLEEALMWQDARTSDRKKRGVEGKYEK